MSKTNDWRLHLITIPFGNPYNITRDARMTKVHWMVASFSISGVRYTSALHCRGMESIHAISERNGSLSRREWNVIKRGRKRSPFRTMRHILSAGPNLLYRYISFLPEINFARERRKNSTFKFLRRRGSLCSVVLFLPFFFFSSDFCLFLPLLFPFFFLLLLTYSKRKIYSLIPSIYFIGSRSTEGRRKKKKRFISLFRATIHYFSKKFTVTRGEFSIIYPVTVFRKNRGNAWTDARVLIDSLQANLLKPVFETEKIANETIRCVETRRFCKSETSDTTNQRVNRTTRENETE